MDSNTTAFTVMLIFLLALRGTLYTSPTSMSELLNPITGTLTPTFFNFLLMVYSTP
jgi:hypothetical protein